MQTYGSDPFNYDFRSALAEARQRLKDRTAIAERLQSANKRTYMERFAAGAFAPTITYGYGRPTKTVNGKVITIEEPSAKSLERHRRLYGSECVELPAENRTIAELRESGLSVREIARVRGISERRVQAQLRVAA